MQQIEALGNYNKGIEFNKMKEQIFADRVRFEVAKHHKQNLREQIDPNLINRIEIDRNPSQNYMNVYKSLCQDQLQKTLQLHQQKKFKEKQFSNQDRLQYTKGIRYERSSNDPVNSLTHSQLSRIGQRFVDYDEQSNVKKQQHVIKNYDGGQSFFKAHDQHLKRKQHQSQLMNQTLQNQLQYKEYLKYVQKMNKNQENQAFKQMKNTQSIQSQQQANVDQNIKKQFRQNIVRQIQEQRIKKQRKSNFQYENLARHNPITNPIEYHIDNPYILRQIQNRSQQSKSYHIRDPNN